MIDRFVVTWLRLGAFYLLATLLASCSTSPVQEKEGPVFYPPLPNPPRIQHLKSFNSIKDLGGSTAFAEFVLGSEANEGLVNKPYGVAVAPGKIYAVDTRGPGYVVLDLAKKKRTLIRGGGAGRMKKPINISIDTDGSKYVTDTARKQVLKFNQQDRFVRAYGVEGQFKPADVAIVDDKLYVSDLEHHEIQILDKKTGEQLGKITNQHKTQDAIIQFPTNMAVQNNKLYISDTGNFKVVQYSIDGTFERRIGEVGSELGKFARPKGINLDREGRLYVVDAAFENVQVFDKEGKLLMFFGEPGNAPDHINLPTDVVVDYDNVKYFQQYAAPGFKLEYLIIVASQFGVNKLNVFGFGKMEGMDYTKATE